MDAPKNTDRLNRFYGDIARVQNRSIMSFITSKNILDIGCGYGFLTKQILDEKAGVNVVGIDIDREALELGKRMYGLDNKYGSVYSLDFKDSSFSTIILREAVHHFDVSNNLMAALKEISRVCAKELIIFDPNPNWIVKISRKIVKHKDEEVSLQTLIKALKENGFSVKKCIWRDVIAFPLSGGFVGPELIPNNKFIKNIVIKVDMYMNNILKCLNIQKYFCWRYLIYATKESGENNE